MERQIPLQGGGVLRYHRAQNKVYLEGTRPDDGRGLYKLWVSGQRPFLLGTMLPHKGGLRLNRTVAVEVLEQEQCWPILSGHCALAFSSGTEQGLRRWQREGNLHQFFAHDPVLTQCVQSITWAWVRREKNGIALALPYNPRAPLDMAPIFCFAQPQQVEGVLHLVFRFDLAGRPRLPLAQGWKSW